MPPRPQPRTRKEWLEYGKALSQNPNKSPREKGAWVKEMGLDFVKDKVERSNAINLYKKVQEGVDLSECPHHRPSDILHWLRRNASGNFPGANSVLYALTNEFMPGLTKIGLTEGNLERRLNNLNDKTSTPADFKVAHFKKISPEYLHLAERAVHELLSNFQIKDRREFFRVPIDIAIQSINLAEGFFSTEELARCGFDKGTKQESLLLEFERSVSSKIEKWKVNFERPTHTDWERYYIRTREMFWNISELADLNKYCDDWNDSREICNAICDISTGIVGETSILEYTDGLALLADNYDVDIDYFTDELTQIPVRIENSNTSECCTWSEIIWKNRIED